MSIAILSANHGNHTPDPSRPAYHFLPPANWMNDPNGTIFYNGEYHLFYQHNPYKPKWGNIHWGHAKSRDLVKWEHLPIALTPSRDGGEKHCYSGCCVVRNGTPTILYTMVGSRWNAAKKAEQWLAQSHDNMLTWRKYPGNPVMTQALHRDKTVLHWRDPYVWREGNSWQMILVGQHRGERFGSLYLYESHDLIHWRYLHPFCVGTADQGYRWECPNFFQLGSVAVLLVSNYKHVLYTLGSYKRRQFKPGAWHKLDLGRSFYATNTFFDGRVILVGWIKGGGGKRNSRWNGLLSLPRVLSLDREGNLLIKPLDGLKELRRKRIQITESLSVGRSFDQNATLKGNCVELKARFKLGDAVSFGFYLTDDHKSHQIAIDRITKMIRLCGQKARLQFLEEGEEIILHIFIDKSVIELFINYRETMTVRFYPTLKKGRELMLRPFSNGTNSRVEVDFWQLEPQGETPTRKPL